MSTVYYLIIITKAITQVYKSTHVKTSLIEE